MSTQLRVLVIDDEPPIRRFLRTSLSAQGYSILEAEDGESGLAMLSRNAIDVVVLDLGLPGIDGLEVLKRLREGGSSIPVIVLSSRDDEKGKVAALEGAPLGATDTTWRAGQTLTIGRNVVVFEYPAAEALAELSRCADEPIRPEDAPPPPLPDDETPSAAAAPEPTPVEDDASRPLGPPRAATPAPDSGWSLTDGVVLVFAACVLVLSVVGFFWLIRR